MKVFPANKPTCLFSKSDSEIKGHSLSVPAESKQHQGTKLGTMDTQVESTRAVLSPAARKRELLAQVPNDPALVETIRRIEATRLCQEKPSQDSYIMIRVKADVAEILDPTNVTRWFRAQVNGALGSNTYAITIFGRNKIELSGEVDLVNGEAWEISPPIITKTRSCLLNERSSMI